MLHNLIMNVAFLFSMLFQNTDSKTQHILFFCLYKGNLHELRKRISPVSLQTLSIDEKEQ